MQSGAMIVRRARSPCSRSARSAAKSRVVAVTAAVCLLAACGASPRTRFYTLAPVPPRTASVTASEAPLKVSAVHIPGVLDRNSIIRGEADHKLDISSQERWGGDLGEMIRQTLTQDLQQRLPDGMVVPPQSPAPDNAHGLVVDVVHFGPGASGQVELDATWTVLAGSPARVVLQRTARLTAHASEPPPAADHEAAGSASSQAAAMSTLLGQLADEIASGLSQVREARQ